MNQPYIFKKQIISIIAIVFIFILSLDYRVDEIFIQMIFFYFLIILTFTFAPILRKNIKYPMFIHSIIFNLPNILPIFIVKINITYRNDYVGMLLGIISGIVLILSNYKNTKEYISNKNLVASSFISTKDFIFSFYLNCFSVISEEIFFRYFLIGYSHSYFGIYSVFISAILFVHVHYINRWANTRFNTRSYIYHYITGIVFGFLFYYTYSIIGCIIAHFIFNSPRFIILFKRLKNNKKVEEYFFNDY